MKLRMLIILSLYLLSMLAITALSVDWMNPQGKSADELISGEVSQANPNQPPNPQKSREVWSNRTGVDFSMPESLSASGKSAKESRANAEATKSQQAEDTADDTTDAETSTAEDTATTEPTSSSGAASVGGSWSFTLDESTPKEMVLTLFQSGDAVYGTGSINTGDSTLVVAASGLVDSDSMNLDVTSIGTIGLYRIALDLDGDSASGSYNAFAASGETWTGNAEGERSVAQ